MKQSNSITIPNIDQLPAELTTFPQFVCWQYGPPRANGKKPKLPINPATGRAADTTDAATWHTFAAAERYSREHGDVGIGFVFAPNDGLIGIDLDNVIDDAGVIRPSVERMATAFGSFSEFSPSGRGMHIIIKGTKPGARCRRGCVELYESGRFFTLTGDLVNGALHDIRRADEALLTLYKWLEGADAVTCHQLSPGTLYNRQNSQRQVDRSDAELLEKARSAPNGAKFKALFDSGDTSLYGGDHSTADAALCRLLAYWCDGDGGRVNDLFERSALMRPKWRQRRGRQTYGEKTISRVLQS